MLNLSPSLMCADYGHFADEIDNLEKAGATSFHIDIMDGVFVKNFAMSWGQVAYCRNHTKLPLEVHLMVDNIEPHIDFILKFGIDLVYLHVENKNTIRAIDILKMADINVGLAVNPETSIEMFEQLLPKVNRLLAMRVHPGFAGQKPIEKNDEKIKYIAQKYRNIEVSIDGGVSLKNIEEFADFGVKGFVLGTSSIFGKKTIRRFCNLL